MFNDVHRHKIIRLKKEKRIDLNQNDDYDYKDS